MPENKDKASQDSASEFLELFKQSYEEPQADDVIGDSYDSTEELSADELKEKLRMQFATDSNVESEVENDPYHIDENFFVHAEEATEELDDISEIEETEEPEEVEEPEETEEFEEIVEFEEPDELEETVELEEAEAEIEEFETIESFEEIPEGIPEENADEDLAEDDDITFDELVETDEDDGITLTKLELDDDVELSAEDDITFEDLERFETQSDTFVLTKLELDDEPTESLRSIFLDEKYVVEPLEDVSQNEEEPSSTTEDSEEKTDTDVTVESDNDYLSEFFANELQPKQDQSDSTVLDAFATTDSTDTAKPTLDSSEMSLLMQFGCDADELSKYAAESDAPSQKEEKPDEKERENRKAKIFAAYEKYTYRRGNVLLRLLISGIFAFVLLFYDGLPILGIELPGIMNRDYYFISYLLMGFQLVALCLLPSYKQLWTGAKKLFSIRPNAYSIVVALAGTVLIYDFTLLFVNDGSIPPVFHFALACVMILALVLELQNISTEKRCFEMFFFDELSSTAGETPKFTLYKSEGKNSTAEKMYAGGVARQKTVYSPLEIQSTDAVMSALKRSSRSRDFSMIAFIPSLAFSLILWLASLIITGQLWVSLCSMIVSMLITLPIVGVFCSWLPFERFSAKSKRAGYSFASQALMEEYSDSDVLVFKDTHLFSKVEASSVNMVLYDATAKDVLLGCLDSVYSQIGGPMETTFSRGDKKRFDNCRIVRVAKNGVEAVVEKNYSVLIGTELFMARYGISFPNASLNSKADQIFTLCVSINGRSTARLAVRYSVNEMFHMFSQRLLEDGIYCAVETFDPMVSSELISKLVPNKKVPVSIVHLNSQNLEEKNIKSRDKFLFDVEGRELGVIALTSRLNLAVALCDAKHMKKMAKRSNLLSLGLCVLGAILAFLTVLFKISEHINELYVFLYWIACISGFYGLVFGTLPKSTRFSFEDFKAEQSQTAMQKIQDRKN